MDSALLIARAKDKLGIASLTPMQREMANVPLPAHLMLNAPTGSGKTLAFALPFLRSLKVNGEDIRGLVIVPTRLRGSAEPCISRFQNSRSLRRP